MTKPEGLITMNQNNILIIPPQPRVVKEKNPDNDSDIFGDTQLTNVFEAFYGTSANTESLIGSHTQTAVKLNDIQNFSGLVFDIDVSRFRSEFRPRVPTYLKKVAPELELRQTSAAGNLHGILQFARPIAKAHATALHRMLGPVLLADPNAGVLAKARVVGSRKIKDNGDSFTVVQVQKGTKVKYREFLGRFKGDGRAVQFAALLTVLTTPDGKSLWDGISSHGICPIHGTGANAKQCAYHPEIATVTCFGDCADGDSRGKTFRLEEVIHARVLTEDEADKEVKREARASCTEDGRPVVVRHEAKPLLQFYREVGKHLAASGEFYSYGGDVIRVKGGRAHVIDKPAKLAGGVADTLEISTPNRHGNAFKRLGREDAAAMLQSNAFRTQLPEIETFTEVPFFDEDWKPIEPGYNPQSKTYYSGPSIAPATGTRALDRFLNTINWRSTPQDGNNADRDNYVALLVTMVLKRHYRGKRPGALFKANRPEVGKTTLARCVGHLDSTSDPPTISFTFDDDELEKRIATHIRRANVIIIDNIRVAGREVASTVLERSITDSHLSFRRLGGNETIERPNDVVFLLTMNEGQVSTDLMTRVVTAELFYEGDPRRRRSEIGDPEDYFTTHREILIAELLGMVTRWREADHPIAQIDHRFRQWAQEVGGILEVNGFADFLKNAERSAAENDPVLFGMTALATRCPGEWKRATDWLQIAAQEGVFLSIYAGGGSERGAASKLGKLLSGYVGQEFSTCDAGPDGQRCRLRKNPDRDGTVYGFFPTERR